MNSLILWEWIKDINKCKWFISVVQPNCQARCNQTPLAQENWFVCMLKHILSFPQCYRITDSDGRHWVTAALDLRLGHSCPRETYRPAVFVFLAEWDILSFPWRGAKTEMLGPPDTGSAPWNLGNGAVPLPCKATQGGVISELCLFVGTLS